MTNCNVFLTLCTSFLTYENIRHRDKQESDMTQMKKRSIWSLAIWGLVLVGLSIVFFSQGGAKTFLDGEQRVTMTRGFMTAGFIFYFLMLYLTRKRQGAAPVLKDERDDLIEKRALMSAFYMLIGLDDRVSPLI